MHTQHRNWFSFIFIGLTFLLILGVMAWIQSPAGGDVESLQIFAPSVEDYQTEINNIIIDFNQDHDAQNAYDELFVLRVPAEFKNLHFSLAMLFFHVAADSDLDIANDVMRLQEQNPWLLLISQ